VCFIFTNSFNFLVLKFKSLMISHSLFSIWFNYEYKLGTSKVRISSSLEEEILITAESLITPPKANKETTYKEPCTSDDEQLCEEEIEEDNAELQHDLSKTNCAYKILIE
jgi:hypothetical protein